MRNGPPAARLPLVPPLVVLTTGPFMRCYSLADPEPAGVPLPPGRKPAGEGPVGREVPAFEPPRHGQVQSRQAVGDQSWPVDFRTSRSSIHMADDHACDPSEIIREPQMGQQTVDPVRRLVDVLPEQNRAL